LSPWMTLWISPWISRQVARAQFQFGGIHSSSGQSISGSDVPLPIQVISSDK
jgi:hypothetical protein